MMRIDSDQVASVFAAKLTGAQITAHLAQPMQANGI
jgi:hypothetical protein